jgi:acyl CoA:acetate/3-ketoacid CoA transferase beta subunit
VDVYFKNTGWTQAGTKLVGTGSIGTEVLQGSSLAISADGSTVVFGGNRDNSFHGATWVFYRANGASTWIQQSNKLFGTGSSAAQQGTR